MTAQSISCILHAMAQFKVYYKINTGYMQIVMATVTRLSVLGCLFPSIDYYLLINLKTSMDVDSTFMHPNTPRDAAAYV